MISRRRFVRHLGCVAAVGQLAGEAFLARRSWAGAAPRDDMVWLDANENPAGPPLSAIKAIVDGAAATARYHFDEFVAYADAIARSEGLTPEQVVKSALRALDTWGVVKIVGLFNALLVFMNRFMPRAAVRWMMGTVTRPPSMRPTNGVKS